MQLGAKDFLKKPISKNELKDKLEKLFIWCVINFRAEIIE
jgi:YesN/AraC family two-component response regulator